MKNVKASELIKSLQDMVAKHGDLDVCFYDEDDGTLHESYPMPTLREEPWGDKGDMTDLDRWFEIAVRRYGYRNN